MNKSSGMLLAVLLLVVANAWGACSTPTTNCLWGCSYYTCSNGFPNKSAAEITDMCNSLPYNSDPKFVVRCPSNSCASEPASGRLYYTYQQCNSVCEADSSKCITAGGTWTNTGASTCNGKSCKMSNCLQSDTLWLNDSKAACDAIGGENNYAITDIDETCVHSGICCPSDSALVGNTCKWRCDSLYTACNAKNGYLYAGVLQDTTISGADSTFTHKCYYNCSYAYNKDSTTSVTDGNTACSSPSTPIADCTRMPNDFSSVRTTYGDSVYSYDFLTPGSAAYIDSIVLTPCSRFMYRCTVNGKYKYWYSDADIPTGCTNIVKIK